MRHNAGETCLRALAGQHNLDRMVSLVHRKTPDSSMESELDNGLSEDDMILVLTHP